MELEPKPLIFYKDGFITTYEIIVPESVAPENEGNNYKTLRIALQTALTAGPKHYGDRKQYLKIMELYRQQQESHDFIGKSSFAASGRWSEIIDLFRHTLYTVQEECSFSALLKEMRDLDMKINIKVINQIQVDKDYTLSL